MIIKFDEIEQTETPAFYGGEGAFLAKRFIDEHNKILRGVLKSGSSIGRHTHVPTSEIIYVLSGEGIAFCDGKEERLFAGDCHYCPKGSWHTLENVGETDLVFLAVVPTHE